MITAENGQTPDRAEFKESIASLSDNQLCLSITKNLCMPVLQQKTENETEDGGDSTDWAKIIH